MMDIDSFVGRCTTALDGRYQLQVPGSYGREHRHDCLVVRLKGTIANCATENPTLNDQSSCLGSRDILTSAQTHETGGKQPPRLQSTSNRGQRRTSMQKLRRATLRKQREKPLTT